MEKLEPDAFFDLKGISFAPLFHDVQAVWDVLDRIKGYALETIRPNVEALRQNGDVLADTHVIHQGQVYTEGLELVPGDVTKGRFEVRVGGRLLEGVTVVYAGAALMDDNIQIDPGVVVEPGALIKGPTIIGERTEVRQGAYIRGSCLVGRSCVVGHATEMKNAVMLDGAKAGHFAYIGDSILGRDVNLGAGTKMANLKIVPGPIRLKFEDRVIQVDRRKFGAILGDRAETGCNSVTSPGSVLGPRCLVAPNMTVPSGIYPPRTVIRLK